MQYMSGLFTHDILYTHSTYNVSLLVLTLNCIHSKSVLMIGAFRIASINKQLICRDLIFFSKRIAKISNLKWNCDLLNQIFKVHIKSLTVIKLRFKSQSLLEFAHHCKLLSHVLLQDAQYNNWFSVHTGWVKKVSCYTVIFQRLDHRRNVKYSIILWTVQELKKVGNINSICVVKYITLHTFMTSCYIS